MTDCKIMLCWYHASSTIYSIGEQNILLFSIHASKHDCSLSGTEEVDLEDKKIDVYKYQ